MKIAPGSAEMDTSSLLQGLMNSDPSDAIAKEEARSAIFAHLHSRLLRLSRKMLDGYPRVRARQHDTSDVFQGAIFDLLRSIEEEPPRDIRHFFSKASRSIRRELARLAREQAALKRSAAGAGLRGASADPSDRPDLLAEWSEFHEQVDRLEGPYREVVDLRWYQGLTEEEAARLMRVDPRTVRNYWRGARDAIRSALGGSLPGMHRD